MSLIKFGQDVTSVDYWIKCCIDKDYKELPHYIEAQKIWSLKKCDLIEIFTNKPNVIEFINNITVIQFYEKDDCYTMIGVIKMNYVNDDDDDYYPEYNYKHFCFIYDPIMLIQRQITLTDYDGFTYDMGMFLKYDYTEDQDAIDKELYGDFRKMTGYTDIGLKDLSTIFAFEKSVAKRC
jgi:hypothetical protein